MKLFDDFILFMTKNLINQFMKKHISEMVKRQKVLPSKTRKQIA